MPASHPAHSASTPGNTMSHYLVELYSPNPAWLALPAAQRQQFLDAVASAMGGLAAMGVQVLALAETERGLDQASPHRFLGDRKSTRLNSSHQIISYAVFCFKKKNETQLP